MSKFILNDHLPGLTWHFLKAYSLSRSAELKIKDTHMNRQFNTTLKGELFVSNNILVLHNPSRDVIVCWFLSAPHLPLDLNKKLSASKAPSLSMCYYYENNRTRFHSMRSVQTHVTYFEKWPSDRAFYLAESTVFMQYFTNFFLVWNKIKTWWISDFFFLSTWAKSSERHKPNKYRVFLKYNWISFFLDLYLELKFKRWK